MAESGFIIVDGEKTEADLYLEEGSVQFSYSNLDAYKDYLKNYPQTKTVYKKSTVLREVRREIRDRKAKGKSEES